MTEQTGLAQSQQGAIGSAIVDLVLAQQGLMTWPFALDTEPLGSDRLLSRADMLWKRAEASSGLPEGIDVHTAYALVDFLADEWSALPPTDMARLLAQAGNLQEWLAMLRPDVVGDSLADAYQRYVAGRYPAMAPESWPDEVVLMLCDQGVVGSANLYRYDPAAELLSIVAGGHEFIRMEPLPDGKGVMLTEVLIRQDGERIYLWQAGRLTPYEPDEHEPAISEAFGPKRFALGRPARQNQTVAWSNDGHWLAELGEGSLTLSAPAAGYQHLIEYDARDCRAVAWVLSNGASTGP